MLLRRFVTMRKRGYLGALLGLALLGCGGSGATPDGGGGGGSSGGPGGRGGAAGGGGSGSGVAGGGSSGGGGAGSGGSVAGSGGGGGATAGASGSGGDGGRGGASGSGGGAVAGRGGGGGAVGGGGGAVGGGGSGGGTAGRGGASGGGGAAPLMTCTAPSQCTGTPVTGPWYCSTTAWSCVDGSCTAECMGSRTCTEAPASGCLSCSSSGGVGPSCIGDACAIDKTRNWRVTQLNCTALPPIDFATWSCWGYRGSQSVNGQLRLCTIQSLPTDAIRYAVSCGECVTIVERI
jgi:hypothetical protein